MNCDLFFDKVYADDTDHVKHFKYFNQFKRFAEVSDVLNGAAEGRQSDSERILVYNIGLSMHDIYFAAKIYQLAETMELGKRFLWKRQRKNFGYKIKFSSTYSIDNRKH